MASCVQRLVCRAPIVSSPSGYHDIAVRCQLVKFIIDRVNSTAVVASLVKKGDHAIPLPHLYEETKKMDLFFNVSVVRTTFHPLLLQMGNKNIFTHPKLTPTMIQALLGLQDCSEFNSCKSIHDFCDHLFPPSRDKLPPNWKEIIKMVPDCPHIIELEKELPSLRSRIKKFDALGIMLAEIYQKTERAKGRTPSEEDFMRYLKAPPIHVLLAALEKTNPFFSRMYNLAGKPKVMITQNIDVGAQYIAESNTIFIQPQSSLEELVNRLIFETAHAVQRDVINQLDQQINLMRIPREAYAIMMEWIETRSLHLHKKALDPMIKGGSFDPGKAYHLLTDNMEKDFVILWPTVFNTRHGETFNGAHPHTFVHHMYWDLIADPKMIVEAARAYKQKKAGSGTMS